MKFFKVFVSLLVFVGVSFSCKKDNPSSKVKKENIEKAEKRNELSVGDPKITFDTEVFDFGTVNEGDVVKHAFLVTNSGDADLIISKAKASCGCTIPTWPKEAIAPGESAQVFVEFDTAGKPNKQIKTITLTTNTIDGGEQVKIMGMVIPEKQ